MKDIRMQDKDTERLAELMKIMYEWKHISSTRMGGRVPLGDEHKMQFKSKEMSPEEVALARQEMYEASKEVAEILAEYGIEIKGARYRENIMKMLDKQGFKQQDKEEGDAKKSLDWIDLNGTKYADVYKLIDDAEKAGDLTPEEAKEMHRQLDKFYEKIGFINLTLLLKKREVRRACDKSFEKLVQNEAEQMFNQVLRDIRGNESSPSPTRDFEM